MELKVSLWTPGNSFPFKEGWKRYSGVLNL
jgi:hypothetical protein